MDIKSKILQEKTLTGMFLTAFAYHYTKVGYILKDEKNKWTKKVTYGELLENIFKFASAIIDAGIKKGDVVSIMSNPRIEFSITDNATLLIGGITGGIYVTDSPQLLEFKLNHLEAKILVIENVKIKDKYQLEKVLSIPKDNLPYLKKIVVIGDYDEKDERLISFSDFLNSAKKKDISDLIAQVEPDDPAVIIYSSGTEGFPKGVVLSHFNVTSNIRQSDEAVKLSKENIKYLDFLPPAHVFGYMVRHSFEAFGSEIYPSHRDTLQDDLREVQPTYIVGVPKFYNMVADAIKKKVAEFGADINNLTDMQKKMILTVAGLGNVKFAVSGAAALPNETTQFFLNNLGFRIDQGYGVSETSPAISVNTENNWKLGTSGKIFKGIKVKILDDDLKEMPPNQEGEIAICGDNVFLYYWKDEEKTKQKVKIIDGERWYLTGDIGFVDEDNFITITDRKDDMLVPISGENVSSISVENKIVTTSRYISYVVPYGTRRDYITCVVWTDDAKGVNIIEDAKKVGIEGKSWQEILLDERFRPYIEDDLKKVLENPDFASHERPKGFIFLVNPDEEEVTGTLKARKKDTRKRYSQYLDELYEKNIFLKIMKK